MREDDRARPPAKPADWEVSAPPAFQIEPLPAPADVLALRLAGELDIATSGALREQVDAALEARVRALVLDLADVVFMDSSTLRELIRAQGFLRGRDGLVVLAGVRPPVERLFALTGTAELFTRVPTREEAFAAAAF
jgi:anti-anti-sigma factor